MLQASSFCPVQLNLDFAGLVPCGAQGLTILWVEFYIKLPQSLRDMMNGINQPYCLTTWLGDADLRAIAATNFARDVLVHTLQEGPIDLLRLNFNLTSSKMDSSNTEAEISSKIVCLASPSSVLGTLFNQLFPGYSKEPHAALYHVRQTYVNQNGNTVFSSVYDYYTQILVASCPFIDMEVKPSSTVWTITCCLAFAHIFQTTATPKTALPCIKGQSSKKCSKPP